MKSGYLKVSKLHRIYYETYGNPKNLPVLWLHGGPGSAFDGSEVKYFDLKKHYVILFDQRGAGLSKPVDEIRENTTSHLVSDIIKLLEFLKVPKVLVVGGSWGSTLALVFAIQHPEKVRGMILRGIFLGTREECRWMIDGSAFYFFPEMRERIKELYHNTKINYSMTKVKSLLYSKDKKVREEIAKKFARIELSFLSLNYDPIAIERMLVGAPKLSLSISRLETHYLGQDCFLPSQYILKNASKLKEIPIYIVHGRYDMVCPPEFAYRLHQKLPQSTLDFVTAGHTTRDKALKKIFIKRIKQMTHHLKSSLL